MKLYNQNTGKVENLKLIMLNGAHMYTDKLTDVQLNDAGYFKLRKESPPARRYYTSKVVNAIVGTEYVTSYTAVNKDVEVIKALMIKDLLEAADKLSMNATLNTSLGFTVKATRNDLDSFERGSKRGILEVRDDKGGKHTVTKQEIDQIAIDIETQGLLLFETKWAKFDEIQLFTTIAECTLYEATPYDVEEEIVNEMGEPTGEGTHIVTKYKNNVKEW